jgi:uncharacterized protein with HEPN domain
MCERDDTELVRDMLEAARRISSYTAALTYETFLADTKTQDAVTRNLEIIGEAVRKLSDELRDAHPNIPWRSMSGLRDRLIHDYFGVNFDIVWEIASHELPQVVPELEKIVGRT